MSVESEPPPRESVKPEQVTPPQTKAPGVSLSALKDHVVDDRQGPFAPSSHPHLDRARSTLGLMGAFVKQGAEAVEKVVDAIDPPEPTPPPTEKEIAQREDFDRRREDQVRREVNDYHQLTTSGEDQSPNSRPERPFLISEDSVVNWNRVERRDANN